MATTDRDPTFLPLTVSTAATLSRDPAADPGVRAVGQAAARTEDAAAECWSALLGGCDAPGRRLLPSCLRALAKTTAAYAGPVWWRPAFEGHRIRLDRAQARIVEAVADRDGADFAEAFVAYDQSVATALVRVHAQSRSISR